MEQMLARAQRKLEDMRRVAKRTLVRGCEAIMTRSKEEFCPVDLGTMRGTGVVIPDPDPEVIAATLQYGGPAAPYTVKQHEDVTLRHTVGEDHFLEKPFREDGPKLLNTVGEAIRL
jgi:hypothetical protein